MSGIEHRYNTRAAARERRESVNEQDQSSQSIDSLDGSAQGLSSNRQEGQQQQQNSGSYLGSIDTNVQSSQSNNQAFGDIYDAFTSNSNNQSTHHHFDDEQENQNFDFID